MSLNIINSNRDQYVFLLESKISEDLSKTNSLFLIFFQFQIEVFSMKKVNKSLKNCSQY